MNLTGCVGCLSAAKRQSARWPARLGGQHEVSAVDRTRQAWEQGREMEERLRLVRAATRLQLQELYRVNFHLHALATSGSDAPHSSCFDLQA